MTPIRRQSRTGRYLPIAYPEEAPFWTAAGRGWLALQRCMECQHVVYPIGPICPRCLSSVLEWQRMSGVGRVSSFVVYHKPWTKWLQQCVPYAVVQVEIQEGPRLTGNLLGVPPSEIAIGLEVRVAFERAARDVTLVQFRPLSTS